MVKVHLRKMFSRFIIVVLTFLYGILCFYNIKKISYQNTYTNTISLHRLKEVSDMVVVSNFKLYSRISSNTDEQKSKKRITKSMIADILEDLMDRIGEESDDFDIDDESDSDDQTDNEEVNSASLLNGVVRIYCTHSEPNFGMPWQRLRQESSTSSGFIIHGNQILTNAHAVEYGTLVQVKKRQSEKKYVAKVIAVGHECDLAILSVSDEEFWSDTSALQFGQLPDLLEDVSVIGFPIGGDSISISSGVVSRIEMQEYAQASAELLAIQIDAAINPGNSGGPVVNSQNEVIGVAFQSLSESDVENIGYVVPVNVIHHFLLDVSKHGRYTGVCGLGVRLQGMDNIQLRKHYGMKSEDGSTGVLVIAIAKLAPVASVLEVNDIILSVDGVKVANDGTIPFREGSFNERVQLNYYFTQRFSSDTVTLEVLRAGKKVFLESKLWVPQLLIPRTLLYGTGSNNKSNKLFISKLASDNSHSSDVTGSDLTTSNSSDVDDVRAAGGTIMGGIPSYLMIGGFVMVALSREYLESEFKVEHMQQFDRWSEELQVLSMTDKYKEAHDQELVILSQVLAHNCNIGYENNRNMLIRSFNGEAVKSLKHLKTMIDQYTATALITQPPVVPATLTTQPPVVLSSSNPSSQSKSEGGIRLQGEGITTRQQQDETSNLRVISEKKTNLVFECANGMVLVLDGQASLEAQKQICAQHFMPNSFSPDLED